MNEDYKNAQNAIIVIDQKLYYLINLEMLFF